MKYQITVERLEDDSYRAYCPAIKDMFATGSSVNAALAHLQQSFICYLHDPDAEMEIQIKDGKDNGRMDLRMDSLQDEGH